MQHLIFGNFICVAHLKHKEKSTLQRHYDERNIKQYDATSSAQLSLGSFVHSSSKPFKLHQIGCTTIFRSLQRY